MKAGAAAGPAAYDAAPLRGRRGGSRSHADPAGEAVVRGPSGAGQERRHARRIGRVGVLFAHLMSVGLDVVDESTNPGYFTCQSLLITALFGRFVVMVLAASLAARDTDCGTW